MLWTYMYDCGITESSFACTEITETVFPVQCRYNKIDGHYQLARYSSLWHERGIKCTDVCFHCTAPTIFLHNTSRFTLPNTKPLWCAIYGGWANALGMCDTKGNVLGWIRFHSLVFKEHTIRPFYENFSKVDVQVKRMKSGEHFVRDFVHVYIKIISFATVNKMLFSVFRQYLGRTFFFLQIVSELADWIS